MTSVVAQRVNLTRHLDWEHGVRPNRLVGLSLSDLSQCHADLHPDDLGDALPYRSHLVAVLKGKTQNIEPTREEK